MITTRISGRDTNSDAGSPSTDDGPTWFRQTRTAAISELRVGFACHGFDVTAYSDTDIGQAVVHEAWSVHNLIARAFARLMHRQDSGAQTEMPRKSMRLGVVS